MHFQAKTSLSEMAQMLNDLLESEEQQMIEIEKMKKEQNTICLNLTKTINHMIEILEEDTKISLENINNYEKTLLNIKENNAIEQEIIKNKMAISENFNEKQKYSNEKEKEALKCIAWLRENEKNFNEK